jgi:TorA maturation chaperone TorD
MMNKETCTESVFPENQAGSRLSVDQRRMLSYETLAAAFSYPDDSFRARFSEFADQAESAKFEYDRLFRAGAVWLYGAEYQATNEFQRAALMSDIMGFYMAFGLEPDKERPDSIVCEMEFMRYLIFKRYRILTGEADDNAEEKSGVCQDAERKFFAEHLEPAATHLANKVIAASDHAFYKQAAEELLVLLKSERNHFDLIGDANRLVETRTGRPAVVLEKVREESTDE